WRRGTTAAAWSAAIVGSALALGGILLSQYWESVRRWLELSGPPRFPLNATQMAFLAAVAASITYVTISLIGRGQFDLDPILHRGRYALPADRDPSRPPSQRSFFAKLFRFDDHFTRRDKWVAGSLLGWTLAIAILNGGICIWQFTGARWPMQWWGRYWLIF